MNKLINSRYDIYLASASPRRKEILENAGIDFRVITPDCDENINEESPWELVEKLSLIKGMDTEQILRVTRNNALKVYGICQP